ncbi:hypothetical protein EVAR_23150_1 [Eumeta japonica]|uniref:Uncharacterized protein n=1 Tax=Eumeta variegata TaxID=151549 RepID=A0A4C1VAP4_EUMVA|nr:hypothetical protein EVAR_23150_1 [Eumeta japonica]
MEPEGKHRNSIMKQRILAVFGLVEIVLKCTLTMNDFQDLMMQLEGSDNGVGSLEAPSSDPESQSWSKSISGPFEQTQIRGSKDLQRNFTCDSPFITVDFSDNRDNNINSNTNEAQGKEPNDKNAVYSQDLSSQDIRGVLWISGELTGGRKGRPPRVSGLGGPQMPPRSPDKILNKTLKMCLTFSNSWKNMYWILRWAQGYDNAASMLGVHGGVQR